MGIVKVLIIKYFISFVRLIQQTFNSHIYSREYKIKEKISYNFVQNINLYISRKINLGKCNQENNFNKLFELWHLKNLC